MLAGIARAGVDRRRLRRRLSRDRAVLPLEPANYVRAKQLDATLAPGALVVMGHYDPSILYTIGRKGWEEDPHVWTPFDEQSAIRKGARYFIAVENARLEADEPRAVLLARRASRCSIPPPRGRCTRPIPRRCCRAPRIAGARSAAARWPARSRTGAATGRPHPTPAASARNRARAHAKRRRGPHRIRRHRSRRRDAARTRRRVGAPRSRGQDSPPACDARAHDRSRGRLGRARDGRQGHRTHAAGGRGVALGPVRAADRDRRADGDAGRHRARTARRPCPSARFARARRRPAHSGSSSTCSLRAVRTACYSTACAPRSGCSRA